MKRALLRSASAALLLATSATCADTPTGPPAPPEPVPGFLVARLTTPHGNDAAIVLRVSGPGITALQSANAAYVFHARAAGSVHRVALFGPLASGAAVRFHVPDVARAADYSGQVLEAADENNVLRDDLGGYGIVIERPSP